MRNLKIALEYDGTNYAGWQVQKQKTVQATLEKALRKILSENIRVIGSGRTDAGVHALEQVANFKTKSALPAQKIQAALNALLPDDIAVTKIEEVAPEFHAIRSAKSKVYRYTILNRRHRSALLRGRVYLCLFPLDVNAMRRQSRCLAGKHDFKAFCASHGSSKTTVRTIKNITVKRIPYRPFPYAQRQKELSLVVIDIEADGFLYNMVRNIAGTLIEIGRGRFAGGSLKKILLSRDRKRAGPTAPARGLCLLQVNY
ncbi:MAG: tRNA pseudouridine(38-40) synthase TruA [Candidatus Omnitrophica bacterium]|nr:tRNA pseudouridine(38-40) synthase TruA [Candidatus Omnitrophota bacterium]